MSWVLFLTYSSYPCVGSLSFLQIVTLIALVSLYFSSEITVLSQTLCSILGIWCLTHSKLFTQSVVVLESHFSISPYFSPLCYYLSTELGFMELISFFRSSISWNTPGSFLLFLRLSFPPDCILCYFCAVFYAFWLLWIFLAACHFFHFAHS